MWIKEEWKLEKNRFHFLNSGPEVDSDETNDVRQLAIRISWRRAFYHRRKNQDIILKSGTFLALGNTKDASVAEVDWTTEEK